MKRLDHHTWEVSEAVLVWMAAGYPRRRIEEGMGLRFMAADGIIRAKKTRASIAGRSAWQAVQALPERPSSFEAEARLLWIALGYSHEQILSGMGLKSQQPDLPQSLPQPDTRT